jgi:hypothetical protein
MKELIQELGINIGISVAGLFGSLILIGRQAAMQWKTTMFSIITGVASANYLTPIVIDIARVDIKYQMSVGFVLGFLGLKGVELISSKFLNTKINSINGTNSSN